MNNLPLAPFLAELTKRIDLAALYRPFRDRYLETIVACHERGSDYYAISGTRPDPEQDALFAIGRKKVEGATGPWYVLDPPKKVVTNAKAGESDHSFGIGVDNSLDKDVERAGLQPGWSMPDYLVLAEEARRLGLNALYWSKTFPEGPHVGLDLKKYGITHAQLRRIQQKGGQTAVWEFLDTVGPW